MFTTGGRVTDIVRLHRCRGQYPAAVRVVRAREPEKRRWVQAVAGITESAGALLGKQRQRIVEPVREMVLDLTDRDLRAVVVLNAWQAGVDLDRGELLPQYSLWDMRRIAYFSNVDLESLRPWVPFPHDASMPVGTARVITAAKDRSRLCRSHAVELTKQLVDPQDDRGHVRYRITRSLEEARKWDDFGQALYN